MSSLYNTTEEYENFELLGSHLHEDIDESSGRLQFRYRVLCRKQTNPPYKFTVVVKMDEEKAHSSGLTQNDLEQEALRRAKERIDNGFRNKNGYEQDGVYTASI